MSNKSRQIVGLDYVRFFAALIVAVYHLGYTTWAVDTSTAKELLMAGGALGYFYPEISAIARGGWVGVEIFFVLSGFVIVYSASSATAKSFAFGRFIRLYPAAWICAAMSFILVGLYGPAGFESGVIQKFVRSFVIFPFGPWIDGAYWTLGVELAFYFLVFTALALGRRGQIYTLAVVVGGVSATFHAWIAYVLAVDGLDKVVLILKSTRFINLLLLGHGVYFAIGALLHRAVFARSSATKSFSLIVLFSLFGVIEISIGTMVKAGREEIVRSIWDGVLPSAIWLAALVLMVFSVLKSDYIYERTSKKGLWFSRHLGLITYPLYLLHSTVGAVVLLYAYRLGMERWSALVVSIVICILSGSLVVLIYESRVQKFLKLKLLG